MHAAIRLVRCRFGLTPFGQFADRSKGESRAARKPAERFRHGIKEKSPVVAGRRDTSKAGFQP